MTRDEFAFLAQLLSRLAANADRATKLADHVQATLEFQVRENGAAAADPSKHPRKRPGRRG
jgi:hypothetical protein